MILLKKNRTLGKVKLKEGSSLIELAIITPVLLLILAGIIQFGFILNAKIAVNAASFEGARAAILSENPEEDAKKAIYYYASSFLPGWSFDEKLNVSIEAEGSDPGDNIMVKVKYSVPVFFHNLISFQNTDFFEIESSSFMQIEEKR